jgi:hypothetical protein
MPHRLRPWSNRIRHESSKLEDGGSSPSGRATRHFRPRARLLAQRTVFTKDETDFAFRSKAHAVRRSVCLECQRSYWRAYYRRDRLGRGERRRRSNATYRERNRIRVLDYLKTHPCVDCGEKDAVVLEFDHVRGVKLGDVSVLTRSAISWRRISAEIEKCEVRCANCHRSKTAKHLAWNAAHRSGDRLGGISGAASNLCASGW